MSIVLDSEFRDGAASFAPLATIGFASGGTGWRIMPPSSTDKTRLQSFAKRAGALRLPIAVATEYKIVQFQHL